MVIKLADVEMGSKTIKPSPTGKRQLEDDPSADLEEEEKRKKSKSAVDDGVLKSLEACAIVIGSSTASPDSRLHCLADLFQSILDKNVNIVLLTEDFPAWVKNAISVVLKDTIRVTSKFFDVVTLAVKVAPTIFESLMENVLKIALFHPRESEDVQESCDNFMEFIVHTFEKLRRFPKFIAKLLCCIRDNLEPNSKYEGRIISSKFKMAIGSVINLLTVGQITDLWKTLQHNLEIECIKPLKEGIDDGKTKAFLCIVVDIFAEFLRTIKVADYTVPGATVEKISEMMEKLCEECLKPIGLLISSREKLELVLVKQYLSLAYAFGQLHGIMLCYNAKYKGKKPSFCLNDYSTNATDLSYLQSYMSGESWINLSNRILKRKDSSVKQLLVNLVAQKLEFMTALEQRFVVTEQENDSTTTSAMRESQGKQSLKESAEFIWTHHVQSKNCVQISDETLTLVSRHMEPHSIIELATIYVQQFQDVRGSVDIAQEDLSNSNEKATHICYRGGGATTENPIFHFALIIEALGEIMRRIKKMKLFPKSLKEILNVLSIETKPILLVELSSSSCAFNYKTLKNSSSNSNLNYNTIIGDLLASVNSAITESLVEPTNTSRKVREEFSSELIQGMLHFLSGLQIETYPKDVKTLVFLCSCAILVALTDQNCDNSSLDEVSKLVVSSGSQSQGNETLFSIHWVSLFQWYTLNLDRFSQAAQLDLCNMILSNVFMSPKFMEEFEKELQRLCNAEKMDSPTGCISLMTLEYILKELQNPKTRLVSQLNDQCNKLTQFVVQKLEDADASSSSNFYRACWLSQLAIDNMDEETKNLYKRSLATKIKKGLRFLKTNHSAQDLSIVYAIRFLHSVCKSKAKVQDELPAGFLNKLWKSCLNSTILQHGVQLPSNNKEKIPKNFVKDIFEASSSTDFQLICNSLMEKTIELANTPHNFKEINMIIQILSEFVDAELPSLNKPIRRHTLQECLHKMLLLTLEWDICDASCLNNAILPYIRLQTKILRRRGAMVNLKTLAVCLMSVTSVPLASVEDSTTFRIVFCALTDLMNALIVHRLDVIAFRSHIFLQCFQYLIECLTQRADQKNKLSDGEILNVRTCGHSIERLCQSMKLGQKELSRVSPYFVTVIIKQFELLAVYPAVKVPLLGGCYKLLDLCDEHGISQLNSLLTIGSKEILKTIYDQYKKYYQYKGRV